MAHECIEPCITINNDTLTTGEFEGTGVFDVLMGSVRDHLSREYKAGRITGDNFTAAYTLAMQNALSQATQYALMKDKTAYEISNLSRQAAILEVQENNLKLEGDNLEVNNRLLESQIITQQKQQDDIAAATVLKESQNAQILAETLNIPKQGLLLDKQVDKLVSDIEVSVVQKDNLVAEGLNIPKQGVLLDKQALDIEVGTELKEAQKAQVEQETINLLTNLELMRAQIDKLIAETEATVNNAGFSTMR